MVQTGRRIVAEPLLEAAVDHGAHAGDRQRRLGDVRREDDLSARAVADGAILRLGVELAVERKNVDLAECDVLEQRLRASDLTGAGKEREHVALGVSHRAANAADHEIRDAAVVLLFEVAYVDGVQAAVALDERRVVQERTKRRGVERRGHHHDPKTGPDRLLHFAKEREREVRVDRPLVNLVEDDRTDVVERGIGLHPARQDPLRDQRDASLLRRPIVEAHLIADLRADLGPELFGEPLRRESRREPPGLEHEHTALDDVRHGRRNPGRLAGPGRREHHDVAARPNGLLDVAEDVVDRKRNDQRRGSYQCLVRETACSSTRRMNRTALLASILALALSGCAKKPDTPPPAPPKAAPPPAEKAPPKPTAEEAKAYIDDVDATLKGLWGKWERAEWVKATHITHDTQILAATAHEEVLKYTSEAIAGTKKFQGLELDEDTKRKMNLLVVSQTMPAPSDAAKRKKLASIASEMEALYGKGKYCKGDVCRDLGQLSEVLRTSRNYDELLDAWVGWRTVSPPMRPMYEEFVDIANDGAKELAYDDVGQLWRGAYDMTPQEFEAETERLWNQVKPLYESLHCYVRAKLAKKYKGKVDEKGKIPAHLLGNMWAQEWANIYPLVEPYRGAGDIDVTRSLQRKKVKPVEMVKMGEKFFTSLGLDPLPKTFWERSQFTKPRDREVVCHASAWDVGMQNDLRIKMCINPTEEDLITIHHELGHNYYYMYYYTLPALYQGGAHDGFHEGIGDTLALSVTPGYLKEAGILRSVKKNEKALINLQMKEALDKIAFLPFGKLIDQWRWDVFAGKVPASEYNAAWWSLREKYQGIGRRRPRAAKSTSTRARSTTSRRTSRTRATSSRGSSSSSSIVRCARKPATPDPSTSARSTGPRRRATG